MARLRSRFRWVFVVVLVAVCLALALAGHRSGRQSEGPWEIRIATATEGGTYHAFGNEFALRLTRFHGDVITGAKALPTQGSWDNIRRLELPRPDRRALSEAPGK